MLKLKLMNIGVISLAKIMAVINALFGFLMGIFVALSKVLGIEATGEGAQLQSFGVAAVIVLPIIYALIGALSGIAAAFFFNLATQWVGPLELNVTERS